MSNHQSDDLHIETLCRDNDKRPMLTLKPIKIKNKELQKIQEGALIEGFEPFNLRIVRSRKIVARAKLGRIGNKEAIHIVSLDEDASIENDIDPKHKLLEGRVAYLSEDSFNAGDVIEFEEPISGRIVILADSHPVALGEIVDYDDEAWVRIIRVLE